MKALEHIIINSTRIAPVVDLLTLEDIMTMESIVKIKETAILVK